LRLGVFVSTSSLLRPSAAAAAAAAAAALFCCNPGNILFSVTQFHNMLFARIVNFQW
jgi:hypothetical protein